MSVYLYQKSMFWKEGSASGLGKKSINIYVNNLPLKKKYILKKKI